MCTSCDIFGHTQKKGCCDTGTHASCSETCAVPNVLCIFLAVSPLHDVWGETQHVNFRGQTCQVSILHCNGLYQPRHRKSLRLEWGEWMFDYFCILFSSLRHASRCMRILQMTLSDVGLVLCFGIMIWKNMVLWFQFSYGNITAAFICDEHSMFSLFFAATVNVAPLISKYCLIDADLFQAGVVVDLFQAGDVSSSYSFYSLPALAIHRDNVKTDRNVKGVLSDWHWDGSGGYTTRDPLPLV